MKLVNYMYKKFFTIFIGALFFFVLVLSLTDLLMNIWNYISKNVSMHDVGLIMMYYVPKTVWYAVPIAMLFATAYMLSDLYAKNELLAVFASGISLFRFTAPLLLVAIIMSFGLFFFEDNVVVPTYAKKQSLQTQVLHKEKSLNNDKIVILSEEGNVIYKADFFDNKLQRLYSLYVIVRNEEKDVEEIIYSDSAVWKDDHWDLGTCFAYKKNGEDFEITKADSDVIAKLTEPPETFRNNTISVEEVNTKEAKAYIEHLEKAGLPSAEAKSEYYKKFSFPFIVFLVVFLAIGLSGKTRKNVMIVSLASSVSAVVIFYVLQMVTMLMAKFEIIPAIVGAWFPVLFFVFVSIILLRTSRT